MVRRNSSVVFLCTLNAGIQQSWGNSFPKRKYFGTVNGNLISCDNDFKLHKFHNCLPAPLSHEIEWNVLIPLKILSNRKELESITVLGGMEAPSLVEIKKENSLCRFKKVMGKSFSLYLWKYSRIRSGENRFSPF